MVASFRSAASAKLAVRVATDRLPQAAAPDLGGLILRIDAQGVVLDYGAAEVDGADPDREKLQARRIDQLLPREVAAAAVRALAAAIESGTAQRIAYASPVAGNRPRHFEARFAPTHGGQCLVTIAAIAAPKTAEALLRSAKKKTTRPRAPRAADLRPTNPRTGGRRLEGEGGDRQRSERALRESEERYRRLVEAGPDAIVIHEAGRIRFASARAAVLAGLADPRELIGRPITEFLHPAERAAEAAPVRRRPEEGDVVDVQETLFQRVNGEPIPVEVTAVAIAEGGRPAVQVVIRDIRKRTRAQQALRESEERYRRLIQTAPIALLTHRQGRIRFANAKAIDLLGVGLPSALKNRSLISFVCDEDRPVVRLRMRRARERRGLVEQGLTLETSHR
jgi:PAS domain S-box-containing protein